MSVAQVFRPVRDAFTGDITDEGYLGDVDGVIIGGQAPRGIRGFESVVDTTGMVGIPFKQRSGIIVEQHDQLKIGSRTYDVGVKAWEEDHTFSGTDTLNEYYWVNVEGTVG
jgi:hypothetical protein